MINFFMKILLRLSLILFLQVITLIKFINKFIENTKIEYQEGTSIGLRPIDMNL